MDSSLQQFMTFLSGISLADLKLYRDAVDNEIYNKLPKNTISYSSDTTNTVNVTSPNITTPNIDDYISYSEHFIDDNTKELLLGEIESLNFNRRAKSGSLQNCFLSGFSDPYVWDSAKGPVENRPKHIDNFPVVKGIMRLINDTYNCDMNSVLVTYYKNGSSKIALHDDSEDVIDSKQPICVLSLGTTRKIEFVGKHQDCYRSTAKSLSPADCSLYTMNAGCQDLFLHRVRMDKKVRGERISLSFRCFIPEANQKSKVVTSIPSTPLMESSISNYPGDAKMGDLSPISTMDLNPSVQGYDPYTSHSTNMSSKSRHEEKLCIIFGTSITDRIDGARMSRGTRKVVNVSYSGANILDVTGEVKAFANDNPRSVENVDKIVFCVGTNEIKWFNPNRRSVTKCFRSRLVNLIKITKAHFPQALIIFRCVLPIRVVYNYTARAVEQFNDLLYDICGVYGCMYSDDFFSEFLKWEWNSFGRNWLRNYNTDLYWDNFHLKDRGLSILCRALKNIIYHNAFNPLPRFY